MSIEDWKRNLVADVLQRLLGTYVKGIDPENLKLNMLNGDVTLENLSLRKEKFEALQLPVTVADGRLDLIRVTVPWRNLGSNPMLISIRGVYLMLTPKMSKRTEMGQPDDADANRIGPLDDDAAETEARREALRTWEAGPGRANDGGDGGFWGGQVKKLLRSVLQKLEVEVSDVHVRVQQGRGASALAAGVRMRSLRVSNLEAPPRGSAPAQQVVMT